MSNNALSRVILITGCSKGLGRFLAENLESEHHIVYAGIRNFENNNDLIASWKHFFPKISPIRLDITSDADVKKAIKDILGEHKKIDVLINVAALSRSGNAEQFTVEDYKNILDTNAVGAFRLIQEVVPAMKREKSGRIINITSLNGILALPNFGIYCSSKFALEALGLALRHELIGCNVWVTNLEPGAIANTAENAGKIAHITVRDRFWILNKLLPMVTKEEIYRKIKQIISSEAPPGQVFAGRDVIIVSLLQRFLPRSLLDWLLRIIWKKQNERT